MVRFTMTRFLIGAGCMLVATLLSGVAMCQDGWDELATRSVDRTLDRDVIVVTNEKHYTALKLSVQQGTVNIYKTTLHYKDGDVTDVKFPEVMSAEQDSVIDLKRNKGVIEKITFWYDTKNSAEEKAVVKIWARK